MQMSVVNNVFVVKCSYEERHIPKGAGFKWDPDKRVWWTKFADSAMGLLRYADSTARERLVEMHRTLQQSYASTSEVQVPTPDGLELYPYQKAGVEFMMNRESVLLADDMGLGKTPQVVCLINKLDWIQSVLIICPAALKLMWKNEFLRWSTRNLTVGVAYGKGEFPSTDVVIINYDILQKFYHELRAKTWDIRVVDECHAIKNPKAMRTKHVLGSWDRSRRGWAIEPIPAKRRVMLTGTPMVNRPVELWPIIRALDPNTWTSYKKFVQRYCNARMTQFGYDVSGASNLEELGKKLRSTIMVRRRKSEVLKELPPKLRQVIEFPANERIKSVLAEERAQFELRQNEIEELKMIVERAELAKDEAAYRAAVERLREAEKVMFTEISRVRHRIGLLKLPQVIAHLRDLEETGQKIVVFAHHIDVIETLHKEFPNSVVLNGSTANKQAPVDEFQNNPKCQFFFGNIKAAGVGITLTASNTVVFAEIDWVPGLITQAEDRCHRVGQRNNVLVQHLVYEGSLDAKMIKMIIEKQRNIDKVMNTDEETAPATTHVATSEPPAREDVVGTISNEDKEQLLRGLRMLAAVCDGAVTNDKRGFNRFDAKFGRSLATLETLTDKQALAAKQMLMKYHLQLPTEVIDAVRR
jgi:SWI/SNF-related matrix-associated actin-dependent regulator 1 of chromatin subfamily A